MTRLYSPHPESLVPTILTDSRVLAQQELDRYAQFSPPPNRVQIDIIDGEFADNITIDEGDLWSLNPHNMQIDLHFMTIEPAEHLATIIGLPQLGMVIGQVEKMTSLEDFVSLTLETLQCGVGLALDRYTPASAISDEILSDIDIVQVMGNHAGWSGQQFDPSVMDKIQELAQRRQEINAAFRLAVDIGVNQDTIPLLRKAGVDTLVINSYLQPPHGEKNWQKLQRSTANRINYQSE